MVLTRGIDGRLKLNPALKLWGGVMLLGVLIVGGYALDVVDYVMDARECEARGGHWIGNPVTVSFCEMDEGEAAT